MPVHHVTDAASLGRALADVRRDAGMSQDELAEWGGVNRRYISVLETGQVSQQVTRLLDLLAVLGYELAVVPKGRDLPSGES